MSGARDWTKISIVTVLTLTPISLLTVFAVQSTHERQHTGCVVVAVIEGKAPRGGPKSDVHTSCGHFTADSHLAETLPEGSTWTMTTTGYDIAFLTPRLQDWEPADR